MYEEATMLSEPPFELWRGNLMGEGMHTVPGTVTVVVQYPYISGRYFGLACTLGHVLLLHVCSMKESCMCGI